MASTSASVTARSASWSIIRTTSAVYGREKTTWGQTQEEHDLSEVNDVAPAGFVTDAKDTDYDPACVHYLHLGFVGVAGNIHYVEFPDFFAGWVGLDPRRDDGQSRGRAARVARARERAERKALARAEAAEPPEAVEVAEATELVGAAGPGGTVKPAEPAPALPLVPPAAVATRPETPAPAVRPRPASVSSPPKTIFCPQCGGRRLVERWPPVPLSGRSGIDARAAAEKRWAGRWCTCWRHEEQPSGPRRARPPVPASSDDVVPDIRSLAQRGDGHHPDGQQP